MTHHKGFDDKICRPGKFCLKCPYPDCIRPYQSILAEETKMIKLAELPDGRTNKRRMHKKKTAKAVKAKHKSVY